MVPDGKYNGTGGSQSTGIGDVLKYSGAGSPPIWVGEIGNDPLHGHGPGEFQHRVSMRIIRKQTKRRVYGSWEYPPPETEMEEAGFEEMGAYVPKRQNIVAQYIETRSVLELCEEMVWRSGAWVTRRWRK